MDSFYTNIGPRRGIAAWMLSTDHKKIGIMYLAALLSFFSVGTLMGVLMRLNLISPGTFMGAQTYNRLFTIHGIVQIFLFIIPGIPVSFGNFFLPIMIGARDVAFPRINRLSWWLYLAGACLMLASLFFGGERSIQGGRFTRLTASKPGRMYRWRYLQYLSSGFPPY